MTMTDADIRRLVRDEAIRVADERIREAERNRELVTMRDIDVRLKGTRHENSDHLDRALLVRKLKPSGSPDDVVLTDATGTAVWGPVPATGGPPTGAAGGVLSGSYPNPGFAADMATQAELDVVSGALSGYLLLTGGTLTGALTINRASAALSGLIVQTAGVQTWVVDSDGSIVQTAGTGSKIALRTGVTGDPNARLDIDASGRMYWGSGSGSADVLLSRTAANELTLASGDVLKLDTRPASTDDTTAATTAFVKDQKLHDFTLPTAATPMNGQKFTGLAAGSANGDSLRYEQVFTTSDVTLLGQLKTPTTSGQTGTLSYASMSFASSTNLGTLSADRLSLLDNAGLNPFSIVRTGTAEATVTGVLRMTTVAISDNSTKLATTAAVKTEVDAHLNDTTAAHAASAISVTDAGGFYAGSDVETVLQELGTATGGTPLASGVSVTPTGLLIPSSTNVQYALSQVEAYVQNLEERFEQHHHDGRYGMLAGIPVKYTSDVSTGAMGAGADSASIASIDITGDGASYTEVEFYTFGPYISAGTAGGLEIRIWDGPTFTGTCIGKRQVYTPAVGSVTSGGGCTKALLLPFSGTKTINVGIYVGSAATVIIQASAAHPSFLIAKRVGA